MCARLLANAARGKIECVILASDTDSESITYFLGDGATIDLAIDLEDASLRSISIIARRAFHSIP